MRGYDLTERGKIIIAVILVTLIFVIPALVLAVNAWNNTPETPEDPPQTETPEDPQSGISNGPLPDGSGFTPVETPKPENGEQGSFDPPLDPPEEMPVPEFGPVGIDQSAGTMSFMYAPDMQESLDGDTISMMGEFVSSPKNTAESQIIVELPDLSDDETSVLINAIADAFAQHDVVRDVLSYVVSPADSNERIFEVNLSFTQSTTMK